MKTNMVNQTYYLSAESIKFLLAENLALKTLLHEKGILTPEEFQVHQKRAMELLEAKVNEQIEIWKKEHPKEAAMMDSLSRMNLQPEDLVAV